MKPIRLRILSLWTGFDEADNWITNLLARHFPIEFCDDPDFMIFSEKSSGWEQHACVRIFYTPENVRPNMERCDWAFSFDHLDHPRHYRLPLYRLYHSPESLVKGPRLPLPAQSMLNRKFCNFLYTNAKAQERVRFFDILNARRPVDSSGGVRPNSDIEVVDKTRYLRDYKFTIAFENASHSGYTTEKIVDPMVAMSLPIYWGNPDIHLDFDPASFVNVMSFASFEAAVERVLELDDDDDAYLEVLSRPWLRNDEPPASLSESALIDRFHTIFTSDLTPRATHARERVRAVQSRLRKRARDLIR